MSVTLSTAYRCAETRCSIRNGTAVMSSSYRLNGEVMRTERVARWRPLFKLGPCHPMYGWITVLFYRAAVVSVTGWFAIVLTGRLPLRPGDYLVAVLRYQRRVLAFLLRPRARQPPLPLGTREARTPD